jgi:hypothetical protein
MGWALAVSGLLLSFFMAFVFVVTFFYIGADGASTIALFVLIAFGILATIVGVRIIRIHSTRGQSADRVAATFDRLGGRG